MRQDCSSLHSKNKLLNQLFLNGLHYQRRWFWPIVCHIIRFWKHWEHPFGKLQIVIPQEFVSSTTNKGAKKKGEELTNMCIFRKLLDASSPQNTCKAVISGNRNCVWIWNSKRLYSQSVLSIMQYFIWCFLYSFS